MSTFRSRLLRGDKLLGTMLSMSSGTVAEILSDAGFDWLFVDAEHGPFEVSSLQTVLQIVGQRTPCLVRIPAIQEVPIKQALDLGAAGIIAPQVNTVAQAEQVAWFCRYPPQGGRGVGIARAQGYGLQFQPYVASANEQTVVIVQAENIQAVENIERIVAVPGIDGVIVGPYDLSASMGLMGQIEHPQVLAAIQHVTDACLKAELRIGIFGVTPAAVQPYVQKGYTLLIAGVDALMLGVAARTLLGELRSRSGGG